ncbi:LLM class flavin-dependent oxidoreductase [Micropruina sonneratiae]|uniref:LLM class flavin-dependent oxidoreductase n=1 Tax=Micropruina sonneratiae TaxID=2986940 RepID=UPI0022271726|nr:LLM class flavin-dependent oxidoreductase [Micropruina sp. KQZ13P-5]MCW3159041.1 LLM class flavin-dependent oxidoreductase [Micropruina sp. KQZ13P-5]
MAAVPWRLSKDVTDERDVPLSILDLAQVLPGESVADGLAATVSLAQRAEGWGYRRIWYAEHHNMPSIASSATAVLIGHVASHTSTIRLGAGGVMLPNHAPLVIAEQFGTLAELHPGRIDLGLGRAPGTDQVTVRALRRDPNAADTFPADVQELQGFLTESVIPGVSATPGKGTNVPLYILGSSLFGAQLAAALGLPYAFASHFAPDALEAAVATYRRDFRPSAQLAEPYVIAGAGVIAADDEPEAQQLFQATRRERVRRFLARGRELSDDDVELLLEGPGGAQVDHMLRYTGVGTGEQVHGWLRRFAAHADADELILVSSASERRASVRSLELVAPTA